MLEVARTRHPAEEVAGHRAPPGFQPFEMRAREARRRCGSDGLQVRPNGTSFGRRFQVKASLLSHSCEL